MVSKLIELFPTLTLVERIEERSLMKGFLKKDKGIIITAIDAFQIVIETNIRRKYNIPDLKASNSPKTYL